MYLYTDRDAVVSSNWWHFFYCSGELFGVPSISFFIAEPAEA